MIKYALILDNINSGVIIVDDAFKVEYWNKWMEVYTDVNAQDAIGKNLDTLFELSDAKVSTLKRKIKSALILKAPSFYTSSSSDTIFPIKKQRITKSFFKDMQQDIKIIPYDVENKKVAILINDTTSLMEAKHSIEEINVNLEKRIEEELVKYREHGQMLIDQSRLAAMGEMIGNIAHQWRQPLNALSLVIGNIKDAFLLERLDEAYLNKASDKANRLIQKMSTTIDDFRDFFKPDKERKNFNVSSTIVDSLLLIEALFKNSSIRVEKELDDTISVFGYHNEFSQVILNIINNAKDALVENRAEERVIKIELTSEDGKAALSISDNAGGIPENIIHRIFEPYYTTKEQGKGTGIGLYMSKLIIEDHMSGSIKAENIKNSEGEVTGAKFIIEI